MRFLKGRTLLVIGALFLNSPTLGAESIDLCPTAPADQVAVVLGQPAKTCFKVNLPTERGDKFVLSMVIIAEGHSAIRVEMHEYPSAEDATADFAKLLNQTSGLRKTAVTPEEGLEDQAFGALNSLSANFIVRKGARILEVSTAKIPVDGLQPKLLELTRSIVSHI